ncbi:RHS repeat-associated core domain-containing protein [Hymenobacter sp. BRD67]|uniref:RHS repeat-associated core domain-containing protein n=1 Tax=Hymenobacter sp. BRD67 TaxID=2675877 RepID=UPI001562F4EA|nr:RHS repeat-associated core domain-containing protein [Hymenobacter sp. BRD67]QKG52852.1 hypothetical protein GKZ67_09860 [Hymenobacter sp. BRD67]
MTIRQPQQGLLVTQEQHYYPFGLPLSGVAVNTLAQPQVSKDQFNGGSTLEDALLGSEGGVYSTFYRNYDPTTGRFQGVDPLADTYADSSPYAFGNNDPVNFNDPNGDEPIIMDGRLMNPRDIATGQETWSGSALDYAAYQLGGPDVRTGDGSGGYLGSYREYDPRNGTYANIQVNGKWVSPYYYTTVKVYTNPMNANDFNDIASLFPRFALNLGNGLKDISDEKQYPGIKIYESSAVVKENTAVTIPGIGIFIHPSIKKLARVQVLQHEYGHFLDFSFAPDINSPTQIPFVQYMFIIGIPSVFDLVRGSNSTEHHDFYTEQRADQWAAIYFGTNYAGK